MNIADIDLDIFLDDVCSLDRRPRAPSTTRPWTGEQLRRFLEDQCGLKRALSSSRPKGRFVVHHDEAFPILNVLSQNGAVPLTLTEADTLIPIFQDYVDFGDVRAQGFPGSGSLPSGKGEAQ
ncbi:hypothetical protein FJV83_28780 [Mesorhizobium sp. WSM4307]|uniref:hypothetical protein n=1 Tax=Mesorhizobium sp. WSM4307 TaxID=2589884 RepID=UPI00115D6996|nr:hypothetical protein [Mesorhizobium sp. WSM4307]TRC79271.1 hypothetical protein FJV83_28780 [Mesorhizobium sp. WSM4307]